MTSGDLPVPSLSTLIHLIRGQRVMMDSDLARLYGVRTKELNKAVARNPGRFPADCAFCLEPEEVARLRFQSGTSNRGRGGRRTAPFVFTEQGVAMLSSVLRSERAIEINVAIMRAFVRLREALSATRELAAKLGELEQRVTGHDEHIRALFEAIRELMTPPDPPPKQIGFHVKEGRVAYGRHRVQRR